MFGAPPSLESRDLDLSGSADFLGGRVGVAVENRWRSGETGRKEGRMIRRRVGNGCDEIEQAIDRHVGKRGQGWMDGECPGYQLQSRKRGEVHVTEGDATILRRHALSHSSQPPLTFVSAPHHLIIPRQTQ